LRHTNRKLEPKHSNITKSYDKIANFLVKSPNKKKSPKFSIFRWLEKQKRCHFLYLEAAHQASKMEEPEIKSLLLKNNKVSVICHLWRKVKEFKVFTYTKTLIFHTWSKKNN